MKKKLLIALSIVALLLVISFSVWLNYFWGTHERKAFLEQEMSAMLHRPVTIQKAKLQIFPRIMMVLNQVKIKERDGKSDFVSLQKLRLGISFGHLFFRMLYFNDLILDQPRITLFRNQKEGFNANDLLGVFSFRKTRENKKKHWLKEFKLSLQNLIIRQGVIVFKDHVISKSPVSLSVTALNLQTGKSSRTGLIPLSLKGIFKSAQKETHINLKGEVEPIIQGSKLAAIKFVGDTQVADLSLSCFGPYFCAWKNMESLQGMIRGTFSFNGIVGEKFTASGDLDISKFKFRHPELSKKKLTINKAHLRFSLTREKEKWTFHPINVVLPEFSVAGKLRVDKTNPDIPLLETEFAIESLDYEAVLPKVPLFFLPEKARSILTEKIKAGKIDKLFFRYSERPSPSSGDKKTKTIEGTFCFRDFSFKWIDEAPSFEHLNGKLSFTQSTLDVTELNGTFGNSKIGRSTITISEPRLLNFSGDFELDLLEMNNLLHVNAIPPHVLKELEKMQSMNGKGLLSLKVSGPLNDLSALAFDGKLTLVDADIDYKNFRKPAKKTNGTFQFTPDIITIKDVTGLWENSPFTCVGEIKDYRSSDKSKIYVHVESENADINDLASAFFPWKGVEGEGLVKIFIDFNCLGYRRQNLRFKGGSEFKDLTLIFPAFPYPFTQVKGVMGFSSDGLTFPHFKFKTGSSDIFFTGLWEGLSKPKVTGKIKGKFVNFLDFYKPKEKEEDKAVNFTLEKLALNVKEGAYKKLMVVDLTTEISSQKGVFYFSAPRATRGMLRDFPFVNVNTIQENQARDATYYNGVVRIPFLKLESGEGYWIGKDISLPVSVDQPERFSLSSEIKNLSTENFLKMFPEKNQKLSGILNLNGTVTGKGRNISEWMDTLNGEVTFATKKGTVRELSILSKLFSLLNVYRIFSQDYSKLLSRGMPYDTIESTFKIEEGIARTDSIFLNAPAMKMNGVGDINLGQETLDMEVAVQPLETVDKVFGNIPIIGTVLKNAEGAVIVTYYKVTGSFENPEWKTMVFSSLGRKGQSIFMQIFNLPGTILNWNGKNNIEEKSQEADDTKE